MGAREEEEAYHREDSIAQARVDAGICPVCGEPLEQDAWCDVCEMSYS